MSGADVESWAIIGIPILAAALCAGSLVLLLPWLKSSALAHPVDRSSHREPTPQGGGLGVVLATLTVTWLAAALAGPLPSGTLALLSALTAAIGLLTLIAFLVLLGMWFVNLVNFMDGIDWMTVAEAVPIAGAVAIFGLGGIVPPLVTL